MLDRLRWGILGTGNIAQQFAAGLASAKLGVVTAVGSREASKSESFARQFRIPQAFGDYESVRRGADVDAVYVSLPNSMHHQWTIAALAAGKHVLCEKPIAATAAQAQEMFDVARRHGRVLMEAFMYRSHPQTLAVVHAIREGAIGQVKLIRTSFCYRTRRIEGNIRFDADLAGGGLMDVGCYCINFSRLIAGAEPTDVHVAGHLHESGVDDLAAGTLTFPSGIVATFSCGMIVQADNTASICGSDGYIQIPVPWKPPSHNAGFTVGRSTPPRMDLVRGATAQPPQHHAIDAAGDLYAIESDDFADSVLHGKPARVSPDDSISNMKILDVMRRKLGVID